MAQAAERDDFEDTEFVIGSDPSGMPPGMKNKQMEEEVDVDIEDEAPKKEAKKKVEEDDFELEIVDDTPPADRNRKPLPDEVKEELDNEVEAEEYSAKVKQRIDQMKKAWHDERRAKEEAAREREAAVTYAKQLQAERDKLRGQLTQGEQWALEQAKGRAQLQLEAAKRAYRDAYEQGDSDAIAEAQQNLSRATYQADQANAMYPLFNTPQRSQNSALQQQPEQVYNQPQQPRVRAPEPDAQAREWGDRNKWFGNDDEMTSFALGLHQKLTKEGIPPSTSEYYERIDARMREVFPDKFEDSAPKKEKRRPSTVVASAGRTPKGKKVVLTQSQVAMAKRLGISPEAYAREVMKLENSNG
jgi:hypothetical protein